MGLRRLFGLCVAATGLAVVVSASLHPPMAGCPGSPADMEGVTLTSMMAVDYCFGDGPVSDANEWFLLLNGVGVSAFPISSMDSPSIVNFAIDDDRRAP